jgi:hypothetical protein
MRAMALGALSAKSWRRMACADRTRGGSPYPSDENALNTNDWRWAIMPSDIWAKGARPLGRGSDVFVQKDALGGRAANDNVIGQRCGETREEVGALR